MAREAELVNRGGIIYEKVPKFKIRDAQGRLVVHPAFIRDGQEIDCFYVQQPVMLSFCRMRSVTRLNYWETDGTLFRDFESPHAMISKDEMLAYSMFMEDEEIVLA